VKAVSPPSTSTAWTHGLTLTSASIYQLKKLRSFCTFGMIKAGAAPAGRVVGGGRIIQQIGPAKFGFRKSTTRAMAEKLVRSVYSAVGHNPDEPFTMLDIEKVKKTLQTIRKSSASN
jgi:hypothetical protein